MRARIVASRADNLHRPGTGALGHVYFISLAVTTAAHQTRHRFLEGNSISRVSEEHPFAPARGTLVSDHIEPFTRKRRWCEGSNFLQLNFQAFIVALNVPTLSRVRSILSNDHLRHVCYILAKLIKSAAGITAKQRPRSVASRGRASRGVVRRIRQG